jgi:hypothetical protein
MADKVADALGAPEIAGTLVNPKGYAKKAVARVAGREVAGLVGSVAAGLAAGEPGAPDLPDFGRVGYVAVSAADVMVLKTKTGWKMTPTDEVIVRASRADLAAVDWDEGKMVSHLTLNFSNGQVWQFDVPRTDKKTARAVVAALQSQSAA